MKQPCTFHWPKYCGWHTWEKLTWHMAKNLDAFWLVMNPESNHDRTIITDSSYLFLSAKNVSLSSYIFNFRLSSFLTRQYQWIGDDIDSG